MSKAYAYTGDGGPEVEAFIERSVAQPAPGQLLIAVHAAGVNPVDWKLRSGYRPPTLPPAVFPVVFGNEASGIVEQVGEDVHGFAVGDAVFGSPVTGGYAEHTLLAAAYTAHKPASVSYADAAALPVAAGTAYDGIAQLALPRGATVLITGVGGGVGVAAAQLALHAGLRVIGTASAAKKDFVESLGVVHVEYGDGVAARVSAAAPEGIDGIYDLVGGAALEAVAPLVADRRALITAADRETVAKLGGQAVVRIRTSATLATVAQYVVDGVLNPWVTEVIPFAEAGAALRAVEAGHARGKVVIAVVS